ncbi:MAG TPA: hypothetical protein VGK55_00725 [Actinomycetes bacterium]
MALSVAVFVSSAVGTVAEVRRTMLLEAKTRFRSGIGLDRSPARLAGGAGAAVEAPVFSVAADTLGRRRRRIWGILHPPVGELVMAVAIDCPTARVATAAAGFFGRRRRIRGTLQPPVGELCRPVATACPPLEVKERAELKPSAVAVTAVVIASYAAVLTAAVADLSASGPADLPIAAAALENRAAALLMTVAALMPLTWERPFGLRSAGGGNPSTPTRAPLGGGIARAATWSIDSPFLLPTGSISGAGLCSLRSASWLLPADSTRVAPGSGSTAAGPDTLPSRGGSASSGLG